MAHADMPRADERRDDKSRVLSFDLFCFDELARGARTGALVRAPTDRVPVGAQSSSIITFSFLNIITMLMIS
jgi:hypothetical protein